MKLQLACFLSFLFVYNPSFAQTTGYLGIPKLTKQGGAEYVSGDSPGTVLMRVNLWGAVNRPGIHHVPVKTDLMALVSYAGGPSNKALLDEVTIKRQVGNTRKLIKVDVEELISGVSHHHVELAPNDIVVIPAKKPLIGNDTIVIVSLASVVISAILAITIIEQNNNR
ncbi:MAG: SLBB domain-containing protein [Pseudomonadota bacterium]